MTKSTTFPMVLKSIVNDAHKADKTFTLNAKQIRSRLRAKLADMHVRNTSWIANNQKEYDAIRSAFDARYAASMTKAPRKARAKKANVETVTA